MARTVVRCNGGWFNKSGRVITTRPAMMKNADYLPMAKPVAINKSLIRRAVESACTFSVFDSQLLGW